MNKKNFLIYIKGNLFYGQIVKVKQKLIERWGKDISKMDIMEEVYFII